MFLCLKIAKEIHFSFCDLTGLKIDGGVINVWWSAICCFQRGIFCLQISIWRQVEVLSNHDDEVHEPIAAAEVGEEEAVHEHLAAMELRGEELDHSSVVEAAEGVLGTFSVTK